MKKYLLALVLVFTLFSFTKISKDYVFPKSGFSDKLISVMQNFNTSFLNCDLDPEKMTSWITDAGIRRFYYCLSSEISIEVIENYIGEKIFLNKVHDGGLNYNSKNEFGHYNPKFLVKLQKEILSLSENQTFLKLGQEIYDNYFKKTARIYYLAYKYVNSDKKNKKQIIKTYKKNIKIQTEEMNYETDGSFYLQEEFRFFAEKKEREGYDVYEGFTAPGFWIRRSIDKTDDEFFELLTLTLGLFDVDFIK